MKYFAGLTFLACALFCANAAILQLKPLGPVDPVYPVDPVPDKRKGYEDGDFEELLPFPINLIDFKDCLLNCSAAVLECFKGSLTGYECLKELNECSQECKEYGYNEEEDNENIGEEHEDEEDYDDEVDDDEQEEREKEEEEENYDEEEKEDYDEEREEENDLDEEKEEEGDYDDEEKEEEGDYDDEEEEEEDDFDDDEEDDEDEEENDDDEDDYDDDEENEYGGVDWERRQKRAARLRSRGNRHCRMRCRKRLFECRKKGGKRPECMREAKMCARNCSGGVRPRPSPRPFPPHPRFRKCWRKCVISLSQCIKGNSSRGECLKSFTGCLTECKKSCGRNGTLPARRDCMVSNKPGPLWAYSHKQDPYHYFPCY